MLICRNKVYCIGMVNDVLQPAILTYMPLTFRLSIGASIADSMPAQSNTTYPPSTLSIARMVMGRDVLSGSRTFRVYRWSEGLMSIHASQFHRSHLNIHLVESADIKVSTLSPCVLPRLKLAWVSLRLSRFWDPELCDIELPVCSHFRGEPYTVAND